MSANRTSSFNQTDRAAAERIGPMRNAVVSYVAGLGASPDVQQAVKLAVSEALTNVAMHAYPDRTEPGPVEVEAWVERGAVIVRVCDEGSGMVPRPDSPGFGLGLPILAQLANDLRVENRPDRPGTRVSMRFDLDRAGSDAAA